MFVWLGQINDAIRMYEEIEPWQFHHCWVILRGEPKWHVKMAECNTGQRVNRKHSLKGSEIDINSMQTNSALPERPEGRDSAKKRSRVMTDTSSSSTAREDAGTRFRAKLASKRGKMRKNSFVGAKPYWPNGSSYFSCSVANKRPMDGQAKSQGQLNGEMAAEYSCPLLEAA